LVQGILEKKAFLNERGRPRANLYASGKRKRKKRTGVAAFQVRRRADKPQGAEGGPSVFVVEKKGVINLERKKGASLPLSM